MAEAIIQTEQSPKEKAEYPITVPTNFSNTGESSAQVESFFVQRPKRIELSEEEVLKRMGEFPSRKDKFVAAIREGKNRSVYP